MKNIYLIDVTNRDGVQTSRILLSKLAKTMLNIYLDDMGIFQSEMGFPTLKHEINYINANLELAKRGVIKNLRLEGWCRAVPEAKTEVSAPVWRRTRSRGCHFPVAVEVS